MVHNIVPMILFAELMFYLLCQAYCPAFVKRNALHLKNIKSYLQNVHRSNFRQNLLGYHFLLTKNLFRIDNRSL